MSGAKAGQGKVREHETPARPGGIRLQVPAWVHHLQAFIPLLAGGGLESHGNVLETTRLPQGLACI